MKTYDIYGAMRDAAASAHESAAGARAVAMRLQHALGVRLLANADSPTRARFGRTLCDDDAVREHFVVSNVGDRERSSPYPEFDYAVVVGLGEPANPRETQEALEGIGLTLLRRRRRDYAASKTRSGSPTLQLYGASTDAAHAVGILSRVLGMAFDGNEQAATGGDSHYYDESERFGTILVFDNMPGPFDDLPLPQYADFRAVVIVVNPPDKAAIRHALLGCGLTLLEGPGSEARP